jgi:hypothetical protein
VQARIAAALEVKLESTLEGVGQAIAEPIEQARKEQKAEVERLIARERGQIDLAIAKLHTEICKEMTDSVYRIERVFTADRVARGLEREADRPNKVN